jgi:hypothetical protein
VAAIDLGKLRELMLDRLERAEVEGDTEAADLASATLVEIDARLGTLARRMAIAAKGATPGSTVKNPHPPPPHVKRLVVGEGRREA